MDCCSKICRCLKLIKPDEPCEFNKLPEPWEPDEPCEPLKLCELREPREPREPLKLCEVQEAIISDIKSSFWKESNKENTENLKAFMKENENKMQIDLQEERAHKLFLKVIKPAKHKDSCERLPNISVVMITLNHMIDDISNRNLQFAIENQFPANVCSLSIASEAPMPPPLEPFIDSLRNGKTMISNEFCSKNCSIDGNTLSKVLATNCYTETIKFFEVTF